MRAHPADYAAEPRIAPRRTNLSPHDAQNFPTASAARRAAGGYGFGDERARKYLALVAKQVQVHAPAH